MQQEDKLIRENLRHVKTIAKRIRRTLPNYFQYDDLYSDGLVGLVKAAKTFKATSEVSFMSYAQHRIRGAILDGLRGEGYTPRNKRGPGFCDGVNFDLLVEDADKRSLRADYLSRLTHDPTREIELRNVLVKWLAALPEKVAAILEAHFLQGKKLKDIANDHGISESRVCQITTLQTRKLINDLTK